MKKISRIIIFALVGILTILLCSCGSTTNTADGSKLKVAVSIAPQAEFAKRLCGDKAEIIQVIPTGYSPETYDPTPRELEVLLGANVYFTLKLPVESTKILANVAAIKTINIAEKCSEKYPDLILGAERDPHIWLSARRALIIIEEMTKELKTMLPDYAEELQKNCDELTAEVQNADNEVKNIIASSGTKEFFVFHPAFGYFADEYGLTMYAMEENGKEATAEKLAKLSDKAKADGIKAVFYQQETDGHQATSFAEEIGGTAIKLSPLAENYSENLVLMAKTIAGIN